MPGVASAATAVVVGHVAAGTRTIRVGSGGVMLPNHSPLVIAEQFGTLESLFPGRIDLGLGRAPGTDQVTAHALRRDLAAGEENFPRDVVELQAYLAPAQPGQLVRAVPGAGLDVPIWLLGSSLFSAQLAAHARAAVRVRVALRARSPDGRARRVPHPVQPVERAGRAVRDGRRRLLRRRHRRRGRRLFTSAQQQFMNLRRGRPGPLPPPVESMDRLWTPVERAGVERALSRAIVGSPATVRRGIADFVGGDAGGRADADRADLRSRRAPAQFRDRGRRSGVTGGRALEGRVLWVHKRALPVRRGGSLRSNMEGAHERRWWR